MKVLLICSKSSVIINFRKKLIEKLQSLGHQVAAIAFDRDNEEEIVSRGIEYHCCFDDNRSLNPFKTLTLSGRIARKIKLINPDIVFTFMLKPNIYGVRGAKKAGCNKIYSMVEGAGDVFINNGIKWKLIRAVVCRGYKKSFKQSEKVFFLNNDDKAEFIRRGLVKDEQCEIVCGVGVDVEHFAYQPVETTDTFLMISRLLPTKGVFEYCEAAKIVKEKYPNVTFNLLGSEGTIKAEDIKEYTDRGIVSYLGQTDDVRPYIGKCGVYVLPSYREGFSVSIMEAQSVGRAVITCDTNGTRDAVRDGIDGFLVPVKDSRALAEKMMYFLEHSDKMEEMGKNARAVVEEKYDHRKINDKICKVIGV